MILDVGLLITNDLICNGPSSCMKKAVHLFLNWALERESLPQVVRCGAVAEGSTCVNGSQINSSDCMGAHMERRYLKFEWAPFRSPMAYSP